MDCFERLHEGDLGGGVWERSDGTNERTCAWGYSGDKIQTGVWMWMLALREIVYWGGHHSLIHTSERLENVVETGSLGQEPVLWGGPWCCERDALGEEELSPGLQLHHRTVQGSRNDEWMLLGDEETKRPAKINEPRKDLSGSQDRDHPDFALIYFLPYSFVLGRIRAVHLDTVHVPVEITN